MNYIIATLGCKVNQYETQALETLLRQRGWTPAEQGHADAVIVNSCAVTAESVRKSRQALRRLAAANPGALTAICGCASQISPADTAALGADLVFGSGDRHAFVDALLSMASGRAGESLVDVDDPFGRRLFEELPAGAAMGRTRAMLKIEDGCDNFCAYCVIPYARGRVRSLPPERAAAQAAALLGEGYREVVVTGIEIASYGKDLPGKPGLIDCVEAVAAAAPGLRLRLGSLEPTVVTEDFCRRLAALGNVCAHFHLSLQSGCDATLERMRRKYDTELFRAAASLLRGHFPGCALTADLITGFPQETEEEFSATLDFLREIAFSKVHVFPYSQREGTRAALMDGQIEKTVKEQRAARARELAARTAADYLRSCVGGVQSVLFERDGKNVSVGHSENYCLVSVPGGHLRGVVKSVQILEVQHEMLVGKVL